MTLQERIIDGLTNKEKSAFLKWVNNSNHKILTAQKRNRRIAAERKKQELQIEQGE